ncbi:MAG TPA: hypothetical protein VEH29_04360 [Acidimicrobiales bacterium]|nr:hypothetical protein [Acidimicrobiales bacterium]
MRSDHPEFVGKDRRAARIALEPGMLARSISFHTASGRHESILEPYGGAPASPGSHACAGLDALTALLGACLASAVVAPRDEVEKWLRFVEPDRRVRAGAAERLPARAIEVEGRAWLTLR